jgi:AraC-like DNA-binding protein
MEFSIFLINCAVPVILSFVLFVNSGKKAPARMFLSGAMLNVALVFFSTWQYISGNYEVYIWVHSLGVAAILFVYPSFYQYLLLLTGKKPIRIHLFLPGFIFGLVSVILFHGLLSHDEKIYFVGNYRIEKEYDALVLSINSWFRLINIVFILFQVVYYYILSVRLLNRYKNALNEHFSNPWEFDLNWVKVLNYSFILAGVACLSFYAINPAKLFGDTAVLTYPFYLLAIVLSALGALGVNQREAPEDMHLAGADSEAIAEEKPPHPSQETSPVTHHDLMTRIEELFIAQRVFLNPELKLSVVATELGTNRTYLSNCINQMTSKSFSKYVNTFRVEYAKTLLDKDSRAALDDIAHASGFGSTAGFIRTFKELTRTTPGDYKKTREMIA